jgi:hypothetical protein
VEVLASARGLTSGKTPLADAIAIQELELGRSYQLVQVSWRPQQVGFAQLAYADDVGLYQPAEIQGESRDVVFLYWKVEEKEAFVPALADIREKVVDAWKQREARKSAQSEAQKLVEAARKSGKSLKDAFADRSDLGVKETNEFSWLSTGLTPASMGEPGLSFVDGVESPGEEFMRSVFALHTGEVGTALNQPQTIVYVVRIISESPGEDALRAEFLQSGRSFETQRIAALAGQQSIRDWLGNLETDLNLTWHRPPRG